MQSWKSEWMEEDWEALVYAIQKGKCILMLGPEAALEEKDGKPQPLGESLANDLAASIKSPIKHELDLSNLMEVAHYYSLEYGGQIYLQNKVRKFYQKRQDLSSSFHRDLASLPFSMVINSSPDDMLFTALTELNKKPGIGWYNFKNKRAHMETVGTVEEPLLFYLCGSIRDEDSLVLTENDLLDFLVSISSGDTLPDRLVHELKSPDKCFLFLGFGFKHWYLRIIFHILNIEKKVSRSFALEDFTVGCEPDIISIMKFFQQTPSKIYFYEQNFNEFAGELRKQYEELAGPGEQTGAAVQLPAPPPPEKVEGPKVFICHASEDKAFAANLYRKLEAGGVAPWLDKEKLRGGGEWDEQIKRTINREIDYFLVLQSKALQSKSIGYVNKEIFEARERQKSFRFGTRFIIPVRIEDCNVLEELDFLQTIDLDSEEKTDELIKIIKRDYTKRGNK